MKPSSPARVTITFNPQNGRFSIRPRTIALTSTASQEVLWRSRNAAFEIRFEPDCTPFRTFRWRCPTGGGCLSGIPPRHRRREKCISYTITLLDAANGSAAQSANGKQPRSKEAYLLLK